MEARETNEQVAVIIPVHNTVAFLPRCLDSVLAQTYPNLEILVVDDGSTDGSSAVLDDYAARDRRIRLFRHERNQGLSAARNTALDAMDAQTAYVYFLDSDDLIMPDCIASLKACLEARQADMVIGQYARVSEKGEILKICPESHFGDDNVIGPEKMLELMVCALIANYTMVHAKLTKRQLFDGYRFPLGKYYEDSYCHHLYGKCRRIAFLNQVVCHYTSRSGSIVYIHDIRLLDKVEMFVDRIQYLREQGYAKLSARCVKQTYKLLIDKLMVMNVKDKAVKRRRQELCGQIRGQSRLTDHALLSTGNRTWIWIADHAFPLLYGFYIIWRKGVKHN